MSEHNTQTHPRVDFMRNEGFLMFTEANQGLLEDLSTYDLSTRAPVSGAEYVSQVEDSPNCVGISSSLSLSTTMRYITGEVIRWEGTYKKALERIEATDEDRKDISKHTLINGIQDQHFPWHFSAGVASSIAYEFVEAGALSQEDYDNLSLTDWAHMISSGWFSKIVHSMAFTGNGIWRTFGWHQEDYYRDGMRRTLENNLGLYSVDKVYGVQSEQGLEGEDAYPIAKLHPQVREALRRSMRMQPVDSVGCPVARLACRVSVENLEEERVQRLLDSGLLTVESKAEGVATLRQETTAIDRTLAFFAAQLMQYDQVHGTPQYVLAEEGPNYIWQGHAFIPATGVFDIQPTAKIASRDKS